MSFPAPRPANEAARLQRLGALAVLDTSREPLFDSLTAAAAALCDTPIALVGLIDAHRQWFKSAIGMAGVTELPREWLFCALALLGDDVMVIEDARRDARYADYPQVTGPDGIRFYAGAPIVLSDGMVVGTLCVVDHVPHAMTPMQRRVLRELAQVAAQALEFRQTTLESDAQATRTEARIAELYKSTPAMLHSIDRDGRLLTVSDAWLAELGYRRDEVLGRPIGDFLDDESRRIATEEVLPRFFTTGVCHDIDYRMVRKDGSVIDIQLSSVLARDAAGRPERSMSVSANVTERRRAERELLEQQARMARILEGTDAGTWEVDIDSDETRYNERWAEIVGYTLEELGRTNGQTWRDLLHPDDLPKAMALKRAHYQGLRDYYECECRVRHRDGSWIWVLDRGRVSARDANGRALWMHGTRADITQRKHAEEALRASQEFLERVGEVAGVGGWVLDFHDRRLSWSEQTRRLNEVDADYQPTVESSLDFFEPAARRDLQDAVREAMVAGTSFDLELASITANGRSFWARAVGSVEFEDGRPRRLVGAFQDITRRKQMERDLAGSRELLQVTLDSIGDAVVTTDNERVVLWLNPVAERMTGWIKAEAVGQPLARIFVAVDEQTRLAAHDPVALCLSNERNVGLSRSITLISRSGLEYGIEDSASPIRQADGRVHGAVLVFRDVSEQRRLSREMSHRATHDLLTGLLNRGEFETRLAALLARGDPMKIGALLYVDLDQFKLVNDACGHAAGDQLLRQVSALLRGCVRGQDAIARLGGDEFGVILEHSGVHDAQRVAQKICDQMDEFRFVHDGRRFRVGTSIGLVPVDERWTSTKALLQAADAACYAAKDAGRNRVHAWFDSDQVLQARHGDMQWVSRLELALDEDRFELFGQRIVPISGAVDGLHFEVLLRLREPGGTLVPPGAFLPAAERFHLATRIDRWVVRNALQQLRAAERADVAIEMMAVNLSGQSLGDRAFHRDVVQLIRQSALDLRKLCFEITETAAITHLAEARSFIEELRSMGVKIALDDFGAGASSFGYLKSLPVDFLKIDGHFVTHLLEDELDYAAVRCFCEVAKVVGVRTIAEFVERQDVCDALAGLGVDLAQGYLMHRPEPLVSLFAGIRPALIAA